MKQLLFIGSILVSMTSCFSPGVEVIAVENAQLRRPLNNGKYQFGAELILDMKKDHIRLDYSEIKVTVNQVYLGKAILAAETSALSAGRQRFPFRVTFPDSILVLTTPNQIQLEGYLTINNKQMTINLIDNQLKVLNLTGM